MRKIIVLFFSISVLLFSCEKEVALNQVKFKPTKKNSAFVDDQYVSKLLTTTKVEVFQKAVEKYAQKNGYKIIFLKSNTPLELQKTLRDVTSGVDKEVKAMINFE